MSYEGFKGLGGFEKFRIGCGKVWVAHSSAPFFSFVVFLALANQAISANAPPELINRGTYVGTYIVIGEVAREGTAEQ